MSEPTTSNGDWWDIVEVLKIPKPGHAPTADPYGEIGIYPSGESMGIYKTEDAAMEAIEALEAAGSERFDEIPYRFIPSHKSFND